MHKKTKIIIGATVWCIFISIFIFAFAASCSQEEPISEKPSQEGLLLNDDLVAIKEDDRNITIKNTETGEVTVSKRGNSRLKNKMRFHGNLFQISALTNRNNK